MAISTFPTHTDYPASRGGHQHIFAHSSALCRMRNEVRSLEVAETSPQRLFVRLFGDRLLLREERQVNDGIAIYQTGARDFFAGHTHVLPQTRRAIAAQLRRARLL